VVAKVRAAKGKGDALAALHRAGRGRPEGRAGPSRLSPAWPRARPRSRSTAPSPS